MRFTIVWNMNTYRVIFSSAVLAQELTANWSLLKMPKVIVVDLISIGDKFATNSWAKTAVQTNICQNWDFPIFLNFCHPFWMTLYEIPALFFLWEIERQWNIYQISWASGNLNSGWLGHENLWNQWQIFSPESLNNAITFTEERANTCIYWAIKCMWDWDTN